MKKNVKRVNNKKTTIKKHFKSGYIWKNVNIVLAYSLK